MQFNFGEDVTVVRAGVKADPYSGETRPDWDDATETLFRFVAVAPGASVETWQIGSNPVDTVYTAYLPFGADVSAQDRIIARGETFEVNGEVARWRSPFTGLECGTAVPLKRRG